jgi:hypothetical protein
MELLRASQDSPGILSSMLFTISRALRVCKALPDSDYLLGKLTDAMRSLVDHLDAYEDFTGLALVGSDLELVDLEEWANGPRNNESIELTMLDLGYRLRLADPARNFRAEYEEPDNRIAAPPNLLQMLAEHQRQLVARGGVQQQVVVAAPGNTPYTPRSPVYVPTPTNQAGGDAAAVAGGGGGVTMQVPVPIPVPVNMGPIAVAGASPVITTHGPMSPGVPVPPNAPRARPVSPRIRQSGAPSPPEVEVVAAAAAHAPPAYRFDSVEHLFIPDVDDGVQVVV